MRQGKKRNISSFLSYFNISLQITNFIIISSTIDEIESFFAISFLLVNNIDNTSPLHLCKKASHVTFSPLRDFVAYAIPRDILPTHTNDALFSRVHFLWVKVHVGGLHVGIKAKFELVVSTD